jgi:hypothetical protein
MAFRSFSIHLTIPTHGDIDLVFVGTEEQWADKFTKPLSAQRLAEFCRMIGMSEM